MDNNSAVNLTSSELHCSENGESWITYIGLVTSYGSCVKNLVTVATFDDKDGLLKMKHTIYLYLKRSYAVIIRAA